MCRFLMVESVAPRRPADWLHRFAEMAERSRSLDGDRQADGWGFAFLDGAEKWRGYWSLRPVWEEEAVFENLPPSRRFLVHARSASFPGQLGKLAYNQPYLGGGTAFVFNGLLRGVSLGRPVAGEIGAQKIWSLFGSSPKGIPVRERFDTLIRTIEGSCREISALNLGLGDAGGFLAYCRASAAGDYYRLRMAEAAGLRLICSEPLDGGDFRDLPLNTIVSI